MHRREYLQGALVVIVLAALLIAATPAAAAPPRSVEHQAGGVHIVQAGETLSAIARRYGVSMTAFVQANGLRNPNFIYAGQRLRIPGAYSAAGAAATSPAAGATHVVQRGESLSVIAARYGVSLSALARANGVSDPNRIYAGQRLVIPAGGAVGGGAAAAPPAAGGRRWIDIDLSAQTLTAYEGDRPIFQRLVSTGLLGAATPSGRYSIQRKLTAQRMTGPGYDLPNVPWVMYFTGRGHAIHGAYWHNNFGSPMSHGCVNMRPGDAQWLYNFASIGTAVVVHR